MWNFFGNTIDNAFFFVVDKIISIQDFFWNQAKGIGRIVLLIAVLSAGLNYALTGQGLKDNVVKILKATVFFFVVFAAYPRIIGFITSWTFDLAAGSVYPAIESHFKAVSEEIESSFDVSTSDGYKTFTRSFIREIKRDNMNLFSDIKNTRSHPKMNYTAVSPSSVVKVIFFIAGECMGFADQKEPYQVFPDFSRILKGIICAFLAIFTGIFALLEYLVCFLEFMLVASVGIILFPLTLWEGSKFMAEGFVKAILGFFIKLLFCTLAIFLLLYGFISVFYTISDAGFKGTMEQIIFLAFSCLLFFFICKSAPGIAQSLLSGTPSLSATGAISAAAGAVAAARAVGGLAKKPVSAVAGGGKRLATGGVSALIGAGAASQAVWAAGGSAGQQAGAFMSSLGGSAAQGLKAGDLWLARSLFGGGSTSIWDAIGKRAQDGAAEGRKYLARHGGGNAGSS